MNPDPVFGEELLAVLGVADFLRREHPRVTKAMHAQALRWPRLARAEIRALIDGTPAPKARGPGPFDYLKVLDQVSRPVDEQALGDMVDAHQEPNDALDVLMPLSRAIAFLSGAAPRRARQTLTGIVQLVPSDQEVERFRRQFVVVNDPLTCLAKMRQGGLLQDEVAALSTVYPGLYGLVGDMVGEELASAKERKGQKWHPSRAVERQLMMLRQMSETDPGLLQDLQATFAGQPAEGEAPPPSGKKIDLKADSFKTVGQAAEAGGR